jgi:hypothetical protein
MQHNYVNTVLEPLNQVEYMKTIGSVVVTDVKTIEELCKHYIEHIQHMQQNTTGKIKKKYESVSEILTQCFKSSFVSNEEKNEKKNEECIVSLISDYIGLLMHVSTQIHFSDKKTSIEYSNELCKLENYQNCSNIEFDKVDYYNSVSNILILLKRKKRNKKNKKTKRGIYMIQWDKLDNTLTY